MDKIEYRAVIQYLFLKSSTPTQIKDELDSFYGDSAPSFTIVKIWAAEFKRGRKSLGDIERSGRPNTVTTDKNIAKVHQMALEDHRVKVKKISEFSRFRSRYGSADGAAGIMDEYGQNPYRIQTAPEYEL
ncbi:HTH_48 domain-containing protein [Trichonephila clavipes]|nr:HTH_48 domain-containing protein [Trichonephila clavipes]